MKIDTQSFESYSIRDLEILSNQIKEVLNRKKELLINTQKIMIALTEKERENKINKIKCSTKIHPVCKI
jgi:hypothetical protein